MRECFDLDEDLTLDRLRYDGVVDLLDALQAQCDNVVSSGSLTGNITSRCGCDVAASQLINSHHLCSITCTFAF